MGEEVTFNPLHPHQTNTSGKKHKILRGLQFYACHEAHWAIFWVSTKPTISSNSQQRWFFLGVTLRLGFWKKVFFTSGHARKSSFTSKNQREIPVQKFSKLSLKSLLGWAVKWVGPHRYSALTGVKKIIISSAHTTNTTEVGHYAAITIGKKYAGLRELVICLTDDKPLLCVSSGAGAELTRSDDGDGDGEAAEQVCQSRSAMVGVALCGQWAHQECWRRRYLVLLQRSSSSFSPFADSLCHKYCHFCL